MATILNPYEALTGGVWLKGNLHLHTTQSDGRAAPQTMIDRFAALGYGFLMFSDHDVYTSEQAYRQWNNRGLVLIPGNELAGGAHLLHVDADRAVPSRPSRQEIINEINAAYRETGRGFAVVNHPDWESKFDHCTIEQLREWTGYLGMEIYNGVIGRLDGSAYALNKWDMLLSEGRRIWGFANDDCHREDEIGLGWNVAYVRERSVAAVVEALRRGRFYCSTGVVITAIEADGAAIRIVTENAHRIAAIKNVGARFAVADAKTIEVRVPANARYVRFACWGVGEQQAWTQPFFIESAGGENGEVACIREWQASPLMEDVSLESATPDEAARLAKTPVRCYSLKETIPGFLDLRPQIQGHSGVVYLRTVVESDRTGRGLLALGYDGPLRVWLNGEQVFYGPGTNPAVIDQLMLYVPFRRGANQLTVAFDSNRGRAWGLYARVEL
jgi:hypothetical protein